MNRRHLKVLVTDLKSALYPGPSTADVPLPEAHQVLYVGPLPDRSRKNCKNCCLYVVDRTCSIHNPNITVAPDAVCGYWVGGVPAAERRTNKVDYVDPDYSGLGIIKGGTSCDNCKWFKRIKAEQGTCEATRDESGDDLMTVHPRGCCARWEAKSGD